jgi:hypothetical protein
MQNNAELIDVLNNNHKESIFNKTCNDVSNRLIGNSNSTQTLQQTKNIQSVPQIIHSVPQSVPQQVAGGLIPSVEKSIPDVIPLQDTSTVITSTVVTPSPYYNIFGYEFSLWMLILGLIILLTIIYFIYKWFFSPSEQIVVMTKSKDTLKLITTKKKLNEEISDSENETENETENNTKPETETNKSIIKK